MRRANPIEKKDLLTLMLNGRDAKTGKQLGDRNIAENVGILRLCDNSYLTAITIASHFPHCWYVDSTSAICVDQC
jgi:hypothetical protein